VYTHPSLPPYISHANGEREAKFHSLLGLSLFVVVVVHVFQLHDDNNVFLLFIFVEVNFLVYGEPFWRKKWRKKKRRYISSVKCVLK
jgi:hypothetical protein